MVCLVIFQVAGMQGRGAISEWEVIDALWRYFTRDPEEILGVYDDASAAKVGGSYIVINLDVFDEISDRLPGMGFYDVGWKSIVMALSDVAAKGARPKACMIGLGLPKGVGIEEVHALAKGLRDAARRYGASIWGGDVGFTDHLYVSVTTLGIGERLVSRSGARPGDAVVTTGTYGLTAAAYKILLKGLRPLPDERALNEALKSAYRPEPKMGLWSIVLEHATAAIDSSDGLAISLHYLAERSNVAIVVNNVPIAESAMSLFDYWGIDPLSASLYEGGEEFELIATVPGGSASRVVEEAAAKGLRVEVIGYVEEGEGVYLERNGERIPVERKGWVHVG